MQSFGSFSLPPSESEHKRWIVRGDGIVTVGYPLHAPVGDEDVDLTKDVQTGKTLRRENHYTHWILQCFLAE